MSVFRRRVLQPAADPVAQELEETKKVISRQKARSDATLNYVQEVLEERDRLLADAVNQTGRAVRKRGRLSPRMRPIP